MTGPVVVVGLGNDHRRDDGVGPAVAAALDSLDLPGVVVVTGIADPLSLLEAWTGAGLAIVIDAAVASPPRPGRVRRCTLADLTAENVGLSSHGVDVAHTHGLGAALGRLPDDLVVLAVEVADTGMAPG